MTEQTPDTPQTATGGSQSASGARSGPERPSGGSQAPQRAVGGFGALRTQIAAAIRDTPARYPDDIAEAVLAVILPTTRITGELHGQAEADVQRVIDLYERWVKSGPPPIGTSMSRWWDMRLAELHDAILNQPTEPAPHDGPTVAECRDVDRNWDVEQEGS
jgi:hypothetical protein